MVSVNIMMITVSAMSIIMSVCIVSMIVMPVRIVSMCIMMTVSLIFRFTEHICLIPCRLDKYLECRVQVYYHEEEYEWDESEKSEKKELHTHDREKCDHCRDDEWKHEKKECYEDRPEIEEYRRVVELHRDTDMPDCHTSRCWERCDRPLAFEYDEHLRIRKTHIQKECKDQIDKHNPRYRYKVLLPKDTQEKYIERDDRERTKDRYYIVRLKEWEKVTKSIENPLKRAMVFLTIAASIGVYHLDDATFCEWCEEHIQEEYTSEDDQYLEKVVIVCEVRERFEEFILFLKYDNIRECHLV